MRLKASILLFICFTLNSFSVKAQKLPAEVEFSGLLSKSGIHILKGEYNQALSCLNSCIKLNPNSSVACFQLARIYDLRRDYSAALHFAKRAFDLKPENKTYSYFLAQLYEMSGKSELAIQYYEKSIPANATFDDYSHFYTICDDLHFSAKKIETLNKMIEIFGYDEELGLALASDYESVRDLKKAEVEYIRLSRIDDSNLKYLNILKSFYARNNKQSELQQVQKRIDELNPYSISGQLDDTFVYRSSGKMNLFYQNLIESLRNDMSASLEKKLTLLNTYVQNNNDYNIDSISIAYQTLCDTYNNNISSYQSYYSFLMLNGRFENAIQIIKLALEKERANFEIWLHYFKVLCLTEEYFELKEASDLAMEYFPELSDVYLYNAVACTYLGDSKSAEENFSFAEELGINFSRSKFQYSFYRGVYYYFTGNVNEAFRFFDVFYNSGLDDYYLKLQYAYFVIDYGKNIPLAQSIIKQYANDTNLNYYFYFVRAYLNLKTGDTKQSREDIMSAIKLDDSKYYVYNLAGDIFAIAKDCTNAVVYWNQAIDRGGNSTLISKKIQNCK